MIISIHSVPAVNFTPGKFIIIHYDAAAAVMSFRVSGFWQYEVYADIRRGFLERKHQTTVGSRVNAHAAVAC